MGILVNTGFDVGSSNPIDNRTVKNTTDERDALVTDGLVYENLKVYCKDTQTEYRWTGTDWETVGSSGSGGDLDLTDYQKKTDNTLTTTDKTVTGAINEVNGNLLDTVGFSADYKNIILNRKNGLNPYTIPISAVINNASLAELKDVDSTDVGNGKILVYDGVTNKHKYVDSSITDEFVKMDSTTDANYLSNLIDKSTVVNDNGVLKVKKLDGQEVTITEINYLKGLTMNVMDLVNAFANGGVKVLDTPLNTASELDTIDRTSFIEGISYIVYVLADETHAGAKTTYLVDKTNTTFFGNADSQRNFTTNPIDLANEVTGKLDNSHIDVDSLWTLLTINDTYKTLTTNNEVFGTHGAKAMYDELTTEMGAKANATDLTTHTSDTDTHVTTTDKARWDKVDEKVDKNSITTTIDSTSTDTQVPSAKAVNELFMRGTLNTKATLVADTTTLKLDITKKNSAWNGAIKLTYVYAASLAEIEMSFISNGVRWAVISGQKYVKNITFTQDSSNTSHYTIGIQFAGKVYGCYQAEVIGDFADINSLTKEAFTGDKTAAYYSPWGKNNGVTLVSAPEDLGLTFPCTSVQLVQAMIDKFNVTIKAGAIGVFNCEMRTKTITDAPSDYGLLHIETFAHDRMIIRFDGIGSSSYTGSWIGQIKGSKGIFSDITWSRLDNESRISELEADVNELFQSVSNGKTAVANAITGKGVTTSTTATFATMATNISKISVSSYKEETKSYNITSSGITPLTITFSANILGVKQVIPPTYSSRITTQTSSDIFTINGKELTLYVTGVGTWKVTALIKA